MPRLAGFALLLLLALADLSWGQCVQARVQRPVQTVVPTAPIVLPLAVPVSTFVPVLVPAFEFRYSPVVSSPPPAPAVVPGPSATYSGDGWPVAPTQLMTGTGGPDPGAALALLRQHCARCHTQPGRAGFSLFDTQGASIGLSGADRRRAYQQVASSAMPPSGRLTEQEVRILEQWSK